MDGQSLPSPSEASLQTQELQNAMGHPSSTLLPERMHLVAENSISKDFSSRKNQPFYSSAQWTEDGTSIIAASSDQCISTFVLPADLLEQHDETQNLQPQGVLRLPEPTQVAVAAPFFSLTDPSTQTLLVGCRDHPVQLYHALPQTEQSAPLCAYKLIRHETEEHITPASLLWEPTGTHFLCGSANRLDYFDISRPGSDGPILTIPTIPSKRHILKGGGVGMKGMVSSLSVSPYDVNGGSVVSAGTWTRWIGMYDLHRTDKAIAHWSIANAENEEFQVDLKGQGIVQTTWSPCGRYLVVNERHSSGLLVYDIRGNGRLLSVLNGRTSSSQQKLHCDIFSNNTESTPGFEVWGGCDNGSVKVWEDVGLQYGVIEPNWDWQACNVSIGSTSVHPGGSVVATSSGGWTHLADDEVASQSGNDTREASKNMRTLDESSIKIWAFGAQSNSEQAATTGP